MSTTQMARHRTTTLCIVATGLVAFASGACSLIFSTNQEQCATNDDCRARGGGFEDLQCVERVCVASTAASTDAGPDVADAGEAGPDPFGCALLTPPLPDPSRKVEMTMRWTDVSGGLPATDSIVRLCSVTDSQCGTPQTDFITSGGAADAGPEAGAGWFALNEQGHVEVMVPYGFDGFFEFVSTQYAPTYRFTAPALRNERNLFDQYVLRSSEIRFLAAQAFGNENAFEEKDHAIVILFARDCFQNPVGSASFTTDAIDPLMKSFVLNGSTPSTTDTKTDAAGRGGFLNVPVQGGKFHTFTGYYEDPTTGQKKKLGSARAFVRPGAAVSIAIAPTP